MATQQELQELNSVLTEVKLDLKKQLDEWGETPHGVETKKLADSLTRVEAQIKSIEEAINTVKARANRQDRTDAPVPFISKSLADDLRGGEGFDGDWNWAKFVHENSSQKESGRITIKGSMSARYRIAELRRKNGLLDNATADALVQEFHVPGVIESPLRVLTIRDLIPSQTVDTNEIEYVLETAFNQLITYTDAPFLIGSNTATVEALAGFYIGQTVTVDPGLGTEEDLIVQALIPNDADFPKSAGSLEFTTNATQDHLTAGAEIVSDTFTFTPEATLRPRASIKYEDRHERVRELSVWIPATRNQMADAGQLRNLVDNRLMHSLKLKEEDWILRGDGGSEQWQGLMTHPQAQAYSWSSGSLLPVPDTKILAVRRSMTLSQLAHYPVDGLIFNPLDWEDIETDRGTDGHFLMAPVMVGDQLMMLWRANVIVTTAMNAGEWLVGAFALACALFDREQSTIEASMNVNDDFIRGRMVILIRMRAAFVIYRPDAFVVGTFDAAPS